METRFDRGRSHVAVSEALIAGRESSLESAVCRPHTQQRHDGSHRRPRAEARHCRRRSGRCTGPARTAACGRRRCLRGGPGASRSVRNVRRSSHVPLTPT